MFLLVKHGKPLNLMAFFVAGFFLSGLVDWGFSWFSSLGYQPFFGVFFPVGKTPVLQAAATTPKEGSVHFG